MKPITWCLLAAWTLAGPVAGAATLRVMQDGSGDYTDIQAAVDASAHGDTIRIGPGQWNTFHPFYYSQVIVHNTQDRDLTFIGSGPDQTILGPSPGGPHDWHYFGIVSRYSQDTIRDVTVTGIYVGVEDISGGVDLASCRFDDCSSGLVTYSPEGATVTECEFVGCGDGVLCLGSGGNVQVSDCHFTGVFEGVKLAGASSATHEVSDCTFTQGIAAAVVLYGQATIWNCHATMMNGGNNNFGAVFDVSDYAQVHVENCTAQSTGYALRVSSYSSMTGTDLVLEGAAGVIFCRVDSEVSIHQSHLLNGGGHTVEAYYYSCAPSPPAPWHLDLTNNYWGTTDVAQIEDWIFIDQAHGPNCVMVDYQPLADGPVQTQRETWGGIKALFE